METNDNAQPCEEKKDETNDRNKEIPLKKEPENVIEFYDIYP